MVSAILMFQSRTRLSMSSIAGATYCVARMTSSSVQPSPGSVSPRMNADLDLDPGVAVAAGRTGRPRRDLHVGEQVAVVGLVDAHHLLHRLRGEPDLVAVDARARLEPPADVQQLDLVGVDDVDVGPGLAQRRDRGTLDLGVPESVGDRAAYVVGEHGPNNRTCYSFAP